MAVTIDEVLEQLNMEDAPPDQLGEVSLYMDAANEWISDHVADTFATRATVKLATLFLVEHLWDSSQRGPASAPIAGEDLVTVSGVGYAIPNRVKELLDAYLTTTAPTYSFPDAVAFPDPAEWPVT